VNRIEKKILKLLLSDGKMNAKEISRKLKQNPSTVQDYMDRLKEKGIIERHSILLNPTTLNLKSFHEIIVELDIDDMETKLNFAESLAENFLETYPEIQYLSISEKGIYMIIGFLSETHQNLIITNLRQQAKVLDVKSTRIIICDNKSNRIFSYFEDLGSI
jgi:DNA-binding Lrp family transcriptional regulator